MKIFHTLITAMIAGFVAYSLGEYFKADAKWMVQTGAIWFAGLMAERIYNTMHKDKNER